MSTCFFPRVIPSVNKNSGKKAKNRFPIGVHLMFEKYGMNRRFPHTKYFLLWVHPLRRQLLHSRERGRHASDSVNGANGKVGIRGLVCDFVERGDLVAVAFGGQVARATATSRRLRARHLNRL